MKKIFFGVAVGILSTTGAWASLIGTTDPTAFNDSVDWCIQFGCNGQTWRVHPAGPPPTAIRVTSASTRPSGSESSYVLQQGSTWMGNFPAGMGVIYNGVSFGNTPAKIAATMNQGVYGAGAYIQTDFFTYDFVASIELFDIHFQSLGVFLHTGYPHSRKKASLSGPGSTRRTCGRWSSILRNWFPRGTTAISQSGRSNWRPFPSRLLSF